MGGFVDWVCLLGSLDTIFCIFPCRYDSILLLCRGLMETGLEGNEV